MESFPQVRSSRFTVSVTVSPMARREVKSYASQRRNAVQQGLQMQPLGGEQNPPSVTSWPAPELYPGTIGGNTPGSGVGTHSPIAARARCPMVASATGSAR